MKAFYLFLAISLSIVACNTDTADTTPPTKTTTPAPKSTATPNPPQAQKMPTKAELEKAEAKNGTDPGGAVVKKTEIIPEAAVSDDGVDYSKLANTACQCAAKSRGTEESHVGQVHVDANSTAFQAEVDCFMAAKNKMTKEAISRQKLIVQMKNLCSDLPGTYVTRVMLTLGQ